MALDPKPAAPVKMIRAVVARGHTVVSGVPPHKECGPGAEVELTREEHDRLAALGFLAVPNAPALPLGLGPVFDEGGVIAAGTDGR